MMMELINLLIFLLVVVLYDNSFTITTVRMIVAMFLITTIYYFFMAAIVLVFGTIFYTLEFLQLFLRRFVYGLIYYLKKARSILYYTTTCDLIINISQEVREELEEPVREELEEPVREELDEPVRLEKIKFVRNQISSSLLELDDIVNNLSSKNNIKRKEELVSTIKAVKDRERAANSSLSTLEEDLKVCKDLKQEAADIFEIVKNKFDIDIDQPSLSDKSLSSTVEQEKLSLARFRQFSFSLYIKQRRMILSKEYKEYIMRQREENKKIEQLKQHLEEQPVPVEKKIREEAKLLGLGKLTPFEGFKFFSLLKHRPFQDSAI